MNTYNEKPNVVSKGAQACADFFHKGMSKDWEKSNEQFNRLYFMKIVAMAILFKSAEQIVSNQEWYKSIKSYRANIVTYSLAVLFARVNKYKDKEFDFKRIWNAQKIYDELENQLVITTKEIFNFIEYICYLTKLFWCYRLSKIL